MAAEATTDKPFGNGIDLKVDMTLPTLSNEAGLKAWDFTLRMNLHELRAIEFIEKNVFEDFNPRQTYLKIKQALTKGTTDSVGILLNEYVTLKRAEFDTFHKYIAKLQQLKERLLALDVDVGQNAHLWLALNGIRATYPEKYERWVLKIENNTLTWDSLITDFAAIANSEAIQPRLSNIVVKKNDKKKGDRKKGDGNTCSTCNKNISKNFLHCNACGHHYPEKAETCY
ncbi:hypothetical protein B0T17DRAFT_613341 [Bombardia bombarda]|uniref:Uncharacterized protein n=1 Tax=Bombardia bombarda TaxID=252184 RepID=A0AA40CGG2_9PEZI|nr:hypothetical protein B0T17DRAFT_613341 [Bombardia bombarda]